jgi:hypothetical protein
VIYAPAGTTDGMRLRVRAVVGRPPVGSGEDAEGRGGERVWVAGYG